MYRIVLVLLFFSTFAFSITTITVTYPVQQYFVEKIALNKVYVRTVYENLKKFNPKDRVNLYRLSSSKYYFIFNLKEEIKFKKLFLSKNSNIATINLTEGIEKIKNKNEVNPYVWMDPLLVRKIAKNIYQQLVMVQKEDKEFFKQNYEKFLKELDELYLEMRDNLLNSETYGFLAYSDCWDYLAVRFRLKVYKNEYKYLNINEIPDFIRFARKENLKKIVIQKDKSYEIAQSLAGHIGAKIIEHNIFSHEWRSNLFMLTRKLARRI